MNTKLKKHIDALTLIDTQRKGWLFLSAFVAATVLGIIVEWHSVQESKLVWVLVSGTLLVSMAWWYWTMRLVRHLIAFKVTESEILTEIVQEIRVIKIELVKDITILVDNDK